MNLETSISKYKCSKWIAYLLSLAMTVLVLLHWHDLTPVAWPIILLFVFTLAFNGGLGGDTIVARLPFYLAVSAFTIFLVLVFLAIL